METQKNDTLNSLIEVALKGEHTTVPKINSIAEYFTLQSIYSGLKKALKSFKKLKSITWSEYVTLLKARKECVEYLFTFTKYTRCVSFYQEEVNNARKSLSEYKNYLYSRHFFSAVLGFKRRAVDDD